MYLILQYYFTFHIIELMILVIQSNRIFFISCMFKKVLTLTSIFFIAAKRNGQYLLYSRYIFFSLNSAFLWKIHVINMHISKVVYLDDDNKDSFKFCIRIGTITIYEISLQDRQTFKFFDYEIFSTPFLRFLIWNATQKCRRWIWKKYEHKDKCF